MKKFAPLAIVAGRQAAPELQRLLDDRQFLAIPKIGDVVRGTVLNASKTEVHINIDGYRSGVIRGQELYNESPEYSRLKIGDTVDATVLTLENELGELELSFRFAGQRKMWDHLVTLRDSGQTVLVNVLEANKGGLLVRLEHVEGFLPVSQLLPDHYPKVPGGDKSRILEKLKSFVGQQFNVKVLDLDPTEEKLIFSEKKIVDDEQQERVGTHKVGERHEGKVTAVTDFGAFVEFGEGLTGLVHISELAWQRVDHPSDVVKIDDVITVEIINIDGAKVFMSRKRTQPDPWQAVEEKYKVGQTVSGRILKINSFGLFVELDPDIHGLAHVSELDEATAKSGSVKIGDTLEFQIISLRPNEHRLGLSRKTPTPQSEPAPAPEA